MRKNHLTVIETEKIVKKKSRNKLIDKKEIEHIQTDKLVMSYFKSTKMKSDLVFSYQHDNQKEKIKFEIELIEETLLLEFNGNELDDEMRLIASQVMEKIIESIRFIYKENEWSLSHYFLYDVKAYEKRKNPLYAETLATELKGIQRKIKIDSKRDTEFLSGVHDPYDLYIYMSGDDAKTFCVLLEELNMATYEKVDKNLYQIHLFLEANESEKLRMKIYFAKEIAKYGYNIWVDYEEE